MNHSGSNNRAALRRPSHDCTRNWLPRRPRAAPPLRSRPSVQGMTRTKRLGAVAGVQPDSPSIPNAVPRNRPGRVEMANSKDVELACPICDGELAAPPVRLAGNMSVRCPNCGDYRLTDSACKAMPSTARTPVLRAVLAHQVAKLPPSTLVTTYLVRDLLQTGKLPEPLERVDLLIRYLAVSTQVGQTVPLVGHHLKARLGCADSGAVHWVIRQADE